MAECGLSPQHDGECVPYTKTKRQVSYNPDAVLCPGCKKRIRLNNNGRIRVHVTGRMGSEKCSLSNTLMEDFVFESEPTSKSIFQKVDTAVSVLFSDPDA